MDHTVTEEQLKELLRSDRFQCEICGNKVTIPMMGSDAESKKEILRDHMKKHGYPWRDPLNESINDFWMFTAEKIQKPITGRNIV